MELRRSCKMMNYDQWEHSILFPWSCSVLWLAEPTVGRKNAHQHEWAAILHYLGPFAAYFAPPTLLLPLFIINHFIAPIMIPQLNHQKMGTVDGICPNFGFCADEDYERVGTMKHLKSWSLCCRWSKTLRHKKLLKMHQIRKWELSRQSTKLEKVKVNQTAQAQILYTNIEWNCQLLRATLC